MPEMFDSIDPSQIPAGQDAAGYVDGRWQTFKVLHGPHVLSVAGFASDDADSLDIEPGDASNDQAPAWVRRELSLGHWRPCVYTSASNAAALLQTLAAAGIDRSMIRLWTAHYTYTPHLCDTGCGLPGAADATQWTDRSGGKNLDESTVADDFFAPPPPSPPKEEDDMPAAEIWNDGTALWLYSANTLLHLGAPDEGSVLTDQPAAPFTAQPLPYRKVNPDLTATVPKVHA